MSRPGHLHASQRSAIPGGFESEGDDEGDGSPTGSPTRTIYDDAQSTLTRSRTGSTGGGGGGGAFPPGSADDDDDDATHLEGYDASMIEHEATRRLMDVESSFLPELSPIAQERDESSSALDQPDTVVPAKKESEAATHTHAHAHEHANTSALETMSSSPTAAAAARTVSRVVSQASAGYDEADDSYVHEYENEHERTPTKTRDVSGQFRSDPPSPSPVPAQSVEEQQQQQPREGNAAKESMRKRPKYLNSRYSSHRASYSSQTSQDASELTIGPDEALRSAGSESHGAESSREMSRSVSLGSMASGVSKLDESDDEPTLETLTEEHTPSGSAVGRSGRGDPATPRGASVVSSNTPTDTVINQRIREFEVPGTVARKFYDKERNMSPERKAGMPTPGGSRVKGLSLKEQSSLIDKLQKDNWKLKLKLYFMDQTIAERSDESVKAMISENVELKTLKFSNTKEIRSLKRTIRELEYKVKERDETIAKERENRQNTSMEASQELETEVTYLRERVESYETEIERLRTENATKEGEKRRFAERANLGGDRSKVGSDGGAREEVEMWKELLETETARKEQANEENRKLREELWQLRRNQSGAPSSTSAQTRDINGETASESTLVEQLRHENAELRREVGAQTSMLTSRNREKERLYQEIEDLKMGQRRSDGRSDTLDRSVSRQHGRSSSRTSSHPPATQLAEAEREQYETKNGQLRDDLASVRMENNQLATEMDKLLDELDAIGNVREELDTLQQKYDELTEDTNQEILAMQRERDEALQGQERSELDFQDLKVEAQERIDALDDELDQTTEAIRQLEDELVARDEETRKLRNEVRMTSEGLDKVEADVQQKVRRIKELELEVDEITAELDAIEKTSIEATAKNEKLMVELESRQNECAFLREEQEGYVVKQSELETAMKAAHASLASERDRVKDLEKRLNEERHQREVIGGKKEQEQQRILNDLNREVSTSKDEARKLRKVVETREVEVKTWQERHFELETTIREVLGDPNGSKSSFASTIAKLQRDLEESNAELGRAKQSIVERDELVKRRDALLETHGLESRKLNDLLEKERSTRRSEKAQYEQWERSHAHTSQTVTQKDKRISELESSRNTDRKQLNKLETEFRDQLTERNQLLLTMWNKLSTLCGSDWAHQNSLVSGHLPTADVVANMLPGFSKNLLNAVKALETHVAGFRTRVKQLDRDLAKDYRQLEEQLHVRLKRLDRLESAVQVSRVSSAASAAPEIAKLRGENKLLRTEVDTLKKHEAIRASRAGAVSVEPGQSSGSGLLSKLSHKASLARHQSTSNRSDRPDSAAAVVAGALGGPLTELGPLSGEAEAAAMTAMVQSEPGQARWIHRLRELERRLKAEREARLLDRSGARKRLEEGRVENEQLKAELERERERRQAAD